MADGPTIAARDGFERTINAWITVAIEARKVRGKCRSKSDFFGSSQELASLWKAWNQGIKRGTLSEYNLKNLKRLVLDGWVEWDETKEWRLITREFDLWRAEKAPLSAKKDKSIAPRSWVKKSSAERGLAVLEEMNLSSTDRSDPEMIINAAMDLSYGQKAETEGPRKIASILHCVEHFKKEFNFDRIERHWSTVASIAFTGLMLAIDHNDISAQRHYLAYLQKSLTSDSADEMLLHLYLLGLAHVGLGREQVGPVSREIHKLPLLQNFVASSRLYNNFDEWLDDKLKSFIPSFVEPVRLWTKDKNIVPAEHARWFASWSNWEAAATFFEHRRFIWDPSTSSSYLGYLSSPKNGVDVIMEIHKLPIVLLAGKLSRTGAFRSKHQEFALWLSFGGAMAVVGNRDELGKALLMAMKGISPPLLSWREKIDWLYWCAKWFGTDEDHERWSKTINEAERIAWVGKLSSLNQLKVAIRQESESAGPKVFREHKGELSEKLWNIVLEIKNTVR